MSETEPHIADPISRQIWDMKYRLKRAGRGAAGPDHRGHLGAGGARAGRSRAARPRALGRQISTRRWPDFGFLPGGPHPRRRRHRPRRHAVQLLRHGHASRTTWPASSRTCKEAALTMQQGGGIGYDFSTLRPKGAPVKGVGADASGPLSFMDVWDAMCRTIMSAGHRRGAMMATLALRSSRHRGLHRGQARPRPAAQVQPLGAGHRRLHARGDGATSRWELVFGGTIYRTVRARALWDQHHARDLRLCRAGRDLHRPHQPREQPRLLRDDQRDQSLRPRRYLGARPAMVRGRSRELVGRPFSARCRRRGLIQRCRAASSPPAASRVLRLQTAEGHALRLTADHPVLQVARLTRWAWRRSGRGRRPAAGDEIVVHDHRGRRAGVVRAIQRMSEGYLLGLLIGDGTLKDRQGGAVGLAGPAGRRRTATSAPGVDGVMDGRARGRAHLAASRRFRGLEEVPGAASGGCRSPR